MILALGERGGDLLDRLEEASAETTRAVLDASERLTTSLNFKTGASTTSSSISPTASTTC